MATTPTPTTPIPTTPTTPPLPATVHDWIDRWQQGGLLDKILAGRLHDDVAQVAAHTPATPSVREDDLATRMLSAAANGIKETFGYVGAALTLATLFVLIDVASWTQPMFIALLSMVAVGGATGLVLLVPTDSGPLQRLAGVSGAVSVMAFAGVLTLVEDSVSVPAVLLGVLVTVLSAALYLRHPQVLLHLTTGASVVATIIFLGEDLVSSAADPVVGAVLLVVSLLWILACETGVIGQPWIGTPFAAASAFAGAALATDLSLFGDLETLILASLFLSGAFAAVGAFTDRLRLIIVGSVGLVFTVPMTFTEVLGLSATTTAAILLPVGLALLAAVLVPALRDRPTA